LSEIMETLRRISEFMDNSGIHYMLIGGYALPFYGQIRTTIDLDIAVHVEDDEFVDVCVRARERGYEVHLDSPLNPYSIFLDEVTGYEIEVWRRPDGITWDQETIRRRREYRINGLKIFVVSPEDFIVTKLARSDRLTQDEMDVKSVLERGDTSLDWEYLKDRCEKAGVWELLQSINEAGNNE